jgi:FMN-dependent NADH-azoreductase
MASILLLTSSPYGRDSRGGHLASQAIASLIARQPDLHLVERDLSHLGGEVVSRPYAEAIVNGHGHVDAVFARSETLIRELEEAAFVILATPMHNFTVPVSLKLWIDFVLRYGRTFAPVDGIKKGLLADRPTLVIVTAGGIVQGPQARQPDHLTCYLNDVFATIGIYDLRFLYLDGLVDPERAKRVVRSGAAALDSDPIGAA